MDKRHQEIQISDSLYCFIGQPYSKLKQAERRLLGHGSRGNLQQDRVAPH